MLFKEIYVGWTSGSVLFWDEQSYKDLSLWGLDPTELGGEEEVAG